MPLIAALDLAAVFVFALSGALLAGRKAMDAFGMFVVAFITGVGGGTVRDVLLGRPVFWLADGGYMAAALLATAIVFAFGATIEKAGRPLALADALGLAVAAPLGAAAAHSVGATWPVVLTMTVVTGSFGGMIRDVICQEPPMILHREVYATAALCGGLAWLAAARLTGEPLLAAGLCALTTLTIRVAAIVCGWSAPRPKGLRR